MPNGVIQAFIFNCTNVSMHNHELGFVAVGIELLFSQNVSFSNITIRNSTQFGVLTYTASSCVFSELNVSGSTMGIFLLGSSSNSLWNSRILDNSNSGITIWGDDNLIHDNMICNNTGYGVNITSFGESRNHVWNNTLIGNNGAGSTYSSGHTQAYDGTNNSWNSTDGYGNYWSDWNTPDANHDGIVDQPYLIDGSAGAQDYYPLTNAPQVPIPEFGMMPFVVMILMAVIVMAGESRRKETS